MVDFNGTSQGLTETVTYEPRSMMPRSWKVAIESLGIALLVTMTTGSTLPGATLSCSARVGNKRVYLLILLSRPSSRYPLSLWRTVMSTTWTRPWLITARSGLSVPEVVAIEASSILTPSLLS